MALGNLGTAINAGISGRNIAQQSAATIANNMSNVETEGYSRKELKYTTQVLGGLGCGLRATEVMRHTDMFKVEQIRVMTSELQRLQTLSTYYTGINQQLGQPGENNTLCASLNDLKKNIEALVARPEVKGARASVIFSAQNLAQDLKRLTTLAQNSRIMADKEITTCVQDINVLLTNIDGLNKEIRYTQSQNLPTTELLDMRDQSLKQLAELMDFRVQYESNGNVSLFTNGGQTLIQSQVHQLTSSPTSGICAAVSYGAGTINGILIDGDPTLDITTSLSGGKLGALIQARDTEFPAFQAALDELTGVLRDKINAIHNRGTASEVPQVLTGRRAGQAVGDNIVGVGNVAIAIVDRATGRLVEKTNIDLAAIGTIGNIINQINGTVNATASLDANGALKIQATNPNYGISIASASAPEATITSGPNSYGFSHYFGLNDFFVTPSTLTGTAPGVAGELEVNPSIRTDVNLLANTSLDINGLVGDQVITAGGNSTLIALVQSFSSQANFAAAGNIPALATSLGDFAAMIISTTADQGRHAKQAYENAFNTHELSLASLESIRGVNIQEEVMKLMQWQRQLKICTQLILTAEEMMDEIMRVKL